ncbi:alkylated DNA repair protein AlkB [Paracoccidioides brasiliensis Pb18]|uniref:mRNA N(6)-methyladenine demethylase n=1 Tax=Paracoccidioides brasiliensis (strain Pb18) TaxID=502780 RepID=C1G8Q2_PARBD|nr:alkylated DNA repair protein AlkB [Paracoccidioides brasiliensis Pb18]EEH47554.2 alkylated DNA repair protein AlkB [Paracoccidioides brasiliensis Pb18]
MVEIVRIDAHERPPDVFRQLFKEYRSLTPSEIDSHPRVRDPRRQNDHGLSNGLQMEGYVPRQSISLALDRFLDRKDSKDELDDIPIYTHQATPGLRIVPSLFPPAAQVELLSRIFHRDLSNEHHKTNIHLHYHLTYPDPQEVLPQEGGSASQDQQDFSSRKRGSFFQDNLGRELAPKDPSVHQPLSIKSLLEKKLRWITLGGQYNWTDKVYPVEVPPPFPEDIANLLHSIFPDTRAEAAIVNLYSPGDTLSVHRDVSEECDTGLISISFGCDGLFMVGHEDGGGCEVIRLRSGDAVYMTGRSRFAWHAVPKIIPSTCPDWLSDWPGTSSPYEEWRGWMANKRINLNVRQMKE